MLASGCTTAELSRRTIDEPSERYYRYIRVNVDLSDNDDMRVLTNRFIKVLEAYGLQIIQPERSHWVRMHGEPGTALLKVDEIERRIETVEHHRTYGRTSLTQNRGRKVYDKPVITLRATLVDIETERTVFQADYVTQDPWYADSATVVATLAGTLVNQLEHEGFITAKLQ